MADANSGDIFMNAVPPDAIDAKSRHFGLPKAEPRVIGGAHLPLRLGEMDLLSFHSCERDRKRGKRAQ
ncbi:MAG: hypothetical protein Pars93KO_23330 [Parasphingorhabdus sp.]